MAKFLLVDLSVDIPRINPIIPLRGEIRKKTNLTNGPNPIIGATILKICTNRIKLILIIPKVKEAIAFPFESDLGWRIVRPIFFLIYFDNFF